jgi:predicted DNA-binding protein YlxM (UPF0122 family)
MGRKYMNLLFDKKESWMKRVELFLDVQTSLRQIAERRGIAHQDAKNIILERISNAHDKMKTVESKRLD